MTKQSICDAVKRYAETVRDHERTGHATAAAYVALAESDLLELVGAHKVGQEGLNADELLDWLESEGNDLRSVAWPTGGDDANVGWQVVGHYMAVPTERVIGTGRTPIEALIDAMKPADDTTRWDFSEENPRAADAVARVAEDHLTESVEVGVARMVESVNGVSWWVYIRVGKRKQEIRQYGARYENRANYEAARLKHLFGQGPRPFILDYPDPVSTPDDGDQEQERLTVAMMERKVEEARYWADMVAKDASKHDGAVIAEMLRAYADMREEQVRNSAASAGQAMAS